MSCVRLLWRAPIARAYMRPKVRSVNTKPEPLQEKWCFLYMNDFEATRWFLEAIKIFGDS